MENKVFDTIASLEEEYFERWEQICNIESPTDFKRGVDAVGEYFVQFAAARAWEVELHREEVSGNVVCITMNPQAPARPITFSGHMDTVFPQGAFGYPPTRRDSDKIYGPGVKDCKGGILAALLAMDALDRCGYRARPLQLLLQSDEENGSRASGKRTLRYICEKAKDTVAFLNLEGQNPGKACLARKGIVTLAFKVSGVEAHAASCATLGANAIVEASHKIIEMDALKDADGITCSTGLIEGGTAVNTVPGVCAFQCNIRYATEEQFRYVMDYARRVCDTVHVPGCTCELSVESQRVAMEYKECNAALLDKINAILTSHGMEALCAQKRNGGSDAADATAYGLPTVDSIGVTGEHIHSTNEYANLASLAEAAKRLALAALYL